jgi:uncharacterized RmlC-like cupin family protein
MGPRMGNTTKWRDGVKVVRGQALGKAMVGTGRATAFDFTGIAGKETWIGTVTMQPKAVTGAHHHGRHEVAIYVVKGRSEIRWGERLDFAAEVGPGDFVYFTPFVPHQERNLSATDTVDFVVVRSDNERIVVALDTVPVDEPEIVS